MERKTIFTSLHGAPARAQLAAGLVLTLVPPVSTDEPTFAIEQALETLSRPGGE